MTAFKPIKTDKTASMEETRREAQNMENAISTILESYVYEYEYVVCNIVLIYCYLLVFIYYFATTRDAKETRTVGEKSK